MGRLRILAALAIGVPLLATAGCGIGPFASAPPPVPLPTVAAPIVPAYLHADVIGGAAARLRKARAAGIRPLATPAVLDYVNRQENELRRQTAGTGVDVIRAGDRLLLRLPASGTFDVGSAEIRPQALSTVSEIGLTLKKYNQSLVDVLGHTDPTGTQASNQTLSQRRAESVARQLRSRGVAAARIATRGYASSHPIADNSTETGRAANRRVEIKLVPLRPAAR
ncbi:MAG TPA: OmpA family protein [Sphingomicrobium sp.]|nr:OmpA family protein [Sphingomicrobium sp.]